MRKHFLKRKLPILLSTALTFSMLGGFPVNAQSISREDLEVNANNGLAIVGNYSWGSGLDLDRLMTASRSITSGKNIKYIYMHRGSPNTDPSSAGKPSWFDTVSDPNMSKHLTEEELPKEFNINYKNWGLSDRGIKWDETISIPSTIFDSSMYSKGEEYTYVIGKDENGKDITKTEKLDILKVGNKVYYLSLDGEVNNPSAEAAIAKIEEMIAAFNNGESPIFKVEEGKIIPGGNSTVLPAPTFTENLTIKEGETEKPFVKECTVGDANITLKVKAEVKEDKGAKISYEWYSIGEEQDIPSSNLLRDLPEANLVGTGESFTFTPSKVGTTYYFATAINGEGDSASRTQSNLATIIVKEGVIEKGEFSITDYVYNMEGKTIKTMAKLKGKAPSGAKITIEANSEELVQVTADDNKEWEAVIPRQHAGTNIKATAIANGKSTFDKYTVPQADGKQVDKFIEDIKLNEAIEVRDNLHNSKDGTNISKDAYWMTDNTKEEEEIKAFKVYVTLIETLLDYKPQISPVDLQYIQNVTLDAMKPYELKIKKGLKDVTATSELTLLVGGNKQGTVTIKDKDAGAIVGDTSSVKDGVYTINNGKKVIITAIPNASNTIAGWLFNGKTDADGIVENMDNLEKLELLPIKENTSVEAIFAPEKDAPIIQEVIDIVKEITNNGEKPFEVSISNDNPTLDEVKTFVESTIKAMLPKGAEVDEIKIEEAKTRATKNYTATVTFRVGDVTFTITIEISVNTGVSEVDLTLKLTGAEHGTVVSVMQEGKDVSTKGSVYTVKPGAEVTFTVAPNDGYKAKWSNNVKEVTSGNPNVVTITPTAPDIITLDFVEDKENTSAITLDVDENGVVKVEVDGTSLTPTGNVYTVENGKTVTFTAIPKTGFEVKEWKGATVDPTNKNVATLKVTDKATVGVTFKEEGKEDPDQTTDAIKILSMQVDGGKFENISQSVTTNVYSNTVDGAVYQIYASLSDPVAKFNANGEATFKFTLTAYSDSENFTGSAVTNFLEGLQIDTTRKVLMKELKPIESPTRELEITLSTEVIKSTDVDNPTEFTINFTYRGSADSNKVKPLVGKAIQIKATTEN